MKLRRSNSPGVAFADHIKTEKLVRHKRSRSFDSDNFFPDGSIRSFLLPLSLVLIVGVVFFRLLYLQVVQGGYYRDLADSNRIRSTIIHAPRGILFDRNGTPLVFNSPGYRYVVGKTTTFLNQDQALSLLATGSAGLEIDSLRNYPYKEAFAHILGYVGQITQEQLAAKEFANYAAGDVIGTAGIEKAYQQQLVGVDGKALVEVDAMGKIVRKLGQKDPIAGVDITLTLDAKLQQAAYLAMKDVKKGAVIVTTPKGEILALVSKPSFDPNLFTLGQHYKAATDAAYLTTTTILTDGDNQPLLNRAISGTYPPGSTFKLITAAAGLEDKKIDSSFEVDDTGVIKIGAFSFANWYFTSYGKTEGKVNVVKAIKRSNDIFFYRLADMLGVEALSLMAKKFGLGQRLGIDVEGEAKGLVPTKAWKERVIGETWYLGDNFHYGIGQGYLLTTPLQVNVWTQVFANNGVVYKPQLLKDSKSEILNKQFISEKTIAIVRNGMEQSCEPTGVGWPFFDFAVKNPSLKIDGKNILEFKISSTSALASRSANIKDYRRVTIACKTGTAQHGDEQTLPHSWITLFAPVHDPQIVVTVLAESSGEGSNVAAPIAKKIVEEWFGR